MAKRYQATFPNGDLMKRTSLDRVYTHAWRIVGLDFQRASNGQPAIGSDMQRRGVLQKGFAGSEELARRETASLLKRWNARGDRDCMAEVVPAGVL